MKIRMSVSLIMERQDDMIDSRMSTPAMVVLEDLMKRVTTKDVEEAVIRVKRHAWDK